MHNISIAKERQRNHSKFAYKMRKFITAFNCCFPELENYVKTSTMFSSPFGVHVFTVSETLHMELINLQCGSELTNIYPTIPKIEFYGKYIIAKNLF